MIFSTRLLSQGHSRAFTVGYADDWGWEIREEEDGRVVKRTFLHNWHRVENVITRFTAEAVRLRSAGWLEAPANHHP